MAKSFVTSGAVFIAAAIVSLFYGPEEIQKWTSNQPTVVIDQAQLDAIEEAFIDKKQEAQQIQQNIAEINSETKQDKQKDQSSDLQSASNDKTVVIVESNPSDTAKQENNVIIQDSVPDARAPPDDLSTNIPEPLDEKDSSKIGQDEVENVDLSQNLVVSKSETTKDEESNTTIIVVPLDNGDAKNEDTPLQVVNQNEKSPLPQDSPATTSKVEADLGDNKNSPKLAKSLDEYLARTGAVTKLLYTDDTLFYYRLGLEVVSGLIMLVLWNVYSTHRAKQLTLRVQGESEELVRASQDQQKKLRDELDQLDEKYQIEMKENSKKSRESSEKIIKLESRVTELQQTIQKEKAGRTEEISGLETRSSQLKTRNEELKARIKALETQAREAEKLLQDEKEKLKLQLEKNSAEHEKHLKELTSTVEEKSREIKEISTKLSMKEKELEEGKETSLKKQQEIAEEVDSLKNQLLQVEKEKDQAIQKKEQQLVKDYEKQMGAIKEKWEISQKENSTKESELVTMKEANEKLHQEIVHQLGETARFKKENEFLKEENAQLKGENAQLQIDNEELKSIYPVLLREMHLKNSVLKKSGGVSEETGRSTEKPGNGKDTSSTPTSPTTPHFRDNGGNGKGTENDSQEKKPHSQNSVDNPFVLDAALSSEAQKFIDSMNSEGLDYNP